MLPKLRSRITYANVISTLALVLAVSGGTAYAVSTIRARDIGYHAVTGSKINWNAISASKVKNSSLSGRDLRDQSVRTEDVRNGSLRAEDFAAGQVPLGPKGDKGDPATSIFGTIAADGKLGSHNNVVASSRGAAGTYTATINQDVSKCAVVATLAIDTAGIVAAQPNGGATPASAQQITFKTRDLGGAPTDNQFSFAVYC